ncbi:hypothetical protein ASE63_19525 [Bosea sp. Root381]|uniref:SDR family NAD(P)-dependent oxidoreductase n=1 Tax=Bosea sp. Root381 TaxID=1736524 RepID=UPI0006FE3B23|nr:SDR family oxidoreductase [Bosea sp. Root381]KRE11934.1 hypothetical protein ASE63_19525 [Bosea sp. Root381]
MAGSLSGRVALVTGGARGIGLAIATALAAAGARLVIHDRDEEAVAVARSLGDTAGHALPIVADLAKPDAVARITTALGRQSLAPDILILGASAEIRQTVESVSDEALILQSEVNLHATARLLKAFVPDMRARGFGRVIAIGSVQEARANADCLYYAATKAAQTSLMRTLARTTEAGDLTFNVIQPGAIRTGRNRAILAQPGREKQALSRIPLGRIGMPEDCAGIALLLCSAEGAYINGAEIAVDGGMRL